MPKMEDQYKSEEQQAGKEYDEVRAVRVAVVFVVILAAIVLIIGVAFCALQNLSSLQTLI